MKKVGIMGGTFNPIHNGHLFLAEYAYEEIGLDTILFMPSRKPPHKASLEVASSEDRRRMTELAIRDNPHFELSALELDREGLSYTADTLTELTAMNPDTEYYFIIGADSLLQLLEWKTPQVIFNLCTIVAAGRNHLPKNLMEQQVKRLHETYGASIILLDMPTIEISSAEIRERIVAGKSIRYYVPASVRSYIEEHGLYGYPSACSQ
jgi:nicotinate-nucleotide adenylyltransferase